MSSGNETGSSVKEGYIHNAYGVVTKDIHGVRTADSSAAFLLSYLRKGQRLLDLGCGQGSITTGLAQAVAPGEVVGLDMEEKAINVARERAAEEGVSNVRFEVGNAYNLSFESDYFDVTYSNGVLDHLHHPGDALKEVWRVLKPGGIIGVRDVDMETAKFAPANPLLEKHVELYIRFRRHLGGDPLIGRNLRALVNNASFLKTHFSSSCAVDLGHTTESIKAKVEGLIQLFTGAKVRETVIELGWADNMYFDWVEEALRTWSESPNAYGSLVWGEAIGWKPK